MLSAFATGSFLTGTAVFFTQIVGLTGAQVGLGMSVAGVVTLLLSLPLGRLSDRVGAKPLWAAARWSRRCSTSPGRWPAACSSFVALLSLLAAISTAGNTGRNVYRIAVFPREVRVRALAYMRSARNVGYTLGALAGGIALAIGTREAIMAVPILTGVLLLLNAVMVSRLPTIERPAAPATHDDETRPGAARLAQPRLRHPVGLQRRAELQPGAAQRRRAALAGRAHRRAAHPAGVAVRHQHRDGGLPPGAGVPRLRDGERRAPGGPALRAGRSCCPAWSSA